MNKIKFKKFKRSIYELLNKTFLKSYLVKRISRKEKNYVYKDNELLESANKIIIDSKNKTNIRVGLIKDKGIHSYYPKYARYLTNNNIYYDFIDLSTSDFIEVAKQYDIIIWRIPYNEPDLIIAKNKIEFLEREFRITFFPSYAYNWMYEEKDKQYWMFKKLNMETIKTFISHDENETLNYIKNVDYPIIYKDVTSSGSQGVIKVNNYRNAKKIMEKHFYKNNSIYFQEFIPDCSYDLRIITIKSKFFLGYYRYSIKGDFRASGSGIVKKTNIPLSVLNLSYDYSKRLGSPYLVAIDYIYDNRDNKYKVIEVSNFIGCETSQQLEVNGVPGLYIYENNKFIFKSGNYWIQELSLNEFFIDYFQKEIEGGGKI